MATIEYKKNFSMSQEEVRAGIEKLAQSLQQEQGLQYRWESADKVLFSHKAGKGFIQIQGKQVCLELKLGMLYGAMAPLLRSKIQEAADKYIV